MADSAWKSHLIPVFPEAVPLLSNLLGGPLLDHLLAKRIITQYHHDEIFQLKRTSVSEDVARYVFQILRNTAAPNFSRFCAILDKVDSGSDLCRLLRKHVSQPAHTPEEEELISIEIDKSLKDMYELHEVAIKSMLLQYLTAVYSRKAFVFKPIFSSELKRRKQRKRTMEQREDSSPLIGSRTKLRILFPNSDSNCFESDRGKITEYLCRLMDLPKSDIEIDVTKGSIALLLIHVPGRGLINLLVNLERNCGDLQFLLDVDTLAMISFGKFAYVLVSQFIDASQMMVKVMRDLEEGDTRLKQISSHVSEHDSARSSGSKSALSTLGRIIVNVDKALKEEFERYRNSVEGLIQSICGVPGKEVQQIEVCFGFIEGMPFSVPSRRRRMEEGRPDIEISTNCVLQIFLPETNEECFLRQKKRLLRTIPSLLAYKDIEILSGSVTVFLTLRGIDFVRFFSDLHDPRVLLSFIRLDSEAAVQFGNLQPVKIARLFRQSSLLLPVAEALRTMIHIGKETSKQYSGTFCQSRFLSAFASLDFADESLKSELRMKKMTAILEETEKVLKSSSDFAKIQFVKKESLRKLTFAALTAKQNVDEVQKMRNSTLLMIEKKRRSALKAASRIGNADYVKMLVDAGMDVRKARGNRRFALEEACRSSRFRVAEVLVRAGANVDEEDKFGRFPLLAACENGNIEATRLLIVSGAAVNKTNKSGQFALEAACNRGDIDTAEFLIDAGADVNLSGKSLLLQACSSGHTDLVKLLLRNGCDPNARNQVGKNALYCACFHRHYSIGALLLASVQNLDSFCDESVVQIIKQQHASVSEISSDAVYIVKAILSRSPVLATVRDEDGRLPHEFSFPLELKNVFFGFWAQYRYRELHAKGIKDQDEVKVCLVGESGAGKTALINSVMNRSEKGGGVRSIAGIFTADTSFAGKLLFFDTSRLHFFYKMLGPWLSASSTIFILVADLTRGEEELRRSSHYWVSFLKRGIFPSEKAHLVVIGSKLDRVGYGLGAAVLNSLVSYLQATFGYWFDVSYHHLDCRKTQNIEFERFKQTLRRLKLFALKAAKGVPAIIEEVRKTFLPIVRNPSSARSSPTNIQSFFYRFLSASSSSSLTSNLRQNVISALKSHRLVPNSDKFDESSCIRFIDATVFKRLMIESVCAGLSEQDQNLLVEFLQEIGEILFVDNTIVLDLPWLFGNVISPLLSSQAYLDRPVAGAISREIIVRVLETFNQRKLENSDDIISLLCRSRICYMSLIPNQTYLFPALFAEHRSPRVWQENRDMTVYVGRRLMSDNVTDIIPPGTMPHIQISAQAAPCFRPSEPIFWQSGLIIERTIGRFSPEGMIVLQDRERAIDFIVRGPEHSEGQCKKHLSDLMDVGTRVLQSKSPETALSLFYISCDELKQLKDFPHAHKSRAVEEAIESSKYSSATVSERGIKDSLRDLLALPENHFQFLPYEARYAVCECLDKDPDGRSALAKRLPGFTAVDRYQCRTADQLITLWSENLDATTSRFADSARALSLLYLLAILNDCGCLELSEEEEKAARNDLAFLEANSPSAIAARRLGRLSSDAFDASSTDFTSQFDVPVTQEERITTAKLVMTLWREIGAMLGFESHDLNSFQEKRHDRDRAQTMLDTWANTRGKSATQRNLIEVLLKNGYTTEVSEIFPGAKKLLKYF